MPRPIIGITLDTDGEKYSAGCGYARMVERAGGVPIHLPCLMERIPEYLTLCGGFVLTGGDDPKMEPWGVPTHPKITPLHPDRQAFEVALLKALDPLPKTPVLGVCLGMQLMSLHAGGRLDQHLPESNPVIAERHWGKKDHPVSGNLGWGLIEAPVQSNHRQAVTSAGRLEPCAMSADGLIEAVRDPARRFYVGVQWHPERTAAEDTGIDVFRRLVWAAGERATYAGSNIAQKTRPLKSVTKPAANRS